MTKQTMIKWYREKSAADLYIIGYAYEGNIYFNTVSEIKPRFLGVEEASRNQGDNLRMRIKKKYKKQLLKKEPVCLGSVEQLNTEKYNKGEIFEKLVTEYFGQVWKKDTVPFWVSGDININGFEVQIKFDGATLMNTKQIEKMKKGA